MDEQRGPNAPESLSLNKPKADLSTIHERRRAGESSWGPKVSPGRQTPHSGKESSKETPPLRASKKTKKAQGLEPVHPKDENF